jgi:hypothetical protein
MVEKFCLQYELQDKIMFAHQKNGFRCWWERSSIYYRQI